MKLLVKVVEARNLRAMDLNGLSDPYVQLQLGKQKYRTKTVKKNLNPSWGEEFSFRVEDLKSRLHLSVWDEDKYFNNDLIGKLRVLISKVFDADNKSLGTCWYTLQPKTTKSKNRNLGEILLTISLSQNNSFIDERPTYNNNNNNNNGGDLLITSSPSRSSLNFRSTSGTETDDVKEDKSFTGRIAQMFQKNGEVASTSTSGRSLAVPDHLLLDTPKLEISEEKVSERKSEEQTQQSSDATFEELIKIMEAKHQGVETPSNLPGGILLDQSYMTTPLELNTLLFGPDSKFMKDLAEQQGTTESQLGPWRIENDGESLKRVLTYIKAASKLIKAVKATEEQTYLKADGKVFAVLASVSTPDVICGSTFKTELLFCISPGPELPSGEPCSRLIISWRMNFLQSTMMKGMIEGGARQGLKDSFEMFVRMLSQNVRPVDSKDLGSNKDQVLASLEVEPQSDWKLATQYLLNFTVISTVFMGLYVLAHILLSMPSTIQGLEFEGLDLPDSIGELIVSGVLVLQGKRVLEMMARFMQARVKRGNDHGVKAQGDGWLLTVALIEGSRLAAIDSTGFSDPYVVFTCNSKTKTSSIKFQKIDPQWNEVFEFDAMDEPPSMLAVEVFDFDGPFYEATSLGRAEINFLKAKLSDLADIWIPLEGKLAQACQSKVHLRIFLNNTRGSNVVQEYLTKMEKEVGKKINLRSPQTNSAFQKLFGLPPEEFLINDFTCHLKRKMLLQGRLFLSARIIGFHANLFGHRTRFFFLWEDIEDIQVLPPTLSTMGSPTIIIILRPGRGVDAKHGAKIQDEQGRLKFHFHSFVSYNVAHRTIMALWKSRALTPEQKVQLVEEEYGGKCLQSEESGSFLVVEDVSMSEIYSSVLHIPTNFFMELFSGGKLDHKVLEKVGCVNYSHTQWELVKPNVYQREVGYKLDKNISQYRGEVTSTQQKSPLSDGNGWVIEEVMTLQGVPLGDYFTLHVRYQIEDNPSRSQECKVQVSLGVSWQKSTKHQNRITKNIVSNLTDRLKSMFSLVEKEYVPGK